MNTSQSGSVSILMQDAGLGNWETGKLEAVRYSRRAARWSFVGSKIHKTLDEGLSKLNTIIGPRFSHDQRRAKALQLVLVA